MATPSQLQQIRSKLQTLLKQYNSYEKLNMQLQNDKEKLEQKLKAQQDEMDRLNEKVAATQINAIVQTCEGKKELEKRINLYLKEIDKCLASLNN